MHPGVVSNPVAAERQAGRTGPTPNRGRDVRVLLVEDSPHIVRAVRQGLEEEGFAVDVATDGEEGDVKCRTTSYDVVILDIMLPKVDGLTLLKRWRAAGITTHV